MHVISFSQISMYSFNTKENRYSIFHIKYMSPVCLVYKAHLKQDEAKTVCNTVKPVLETSGCVMPTAAYESNTFEQITSFGSI